MKALRIVQELSAIAMISAGSGLLLLPLLADFTHLQRLAVVGGTVVMVVAYRFKRKGKRRNRVSGTQLKWRGASFATKTNRGATIK